MPRWAIAVMAATSTSTAERSSTRSSSAGLVAIDRMMQQLKRSGKLKKLAGLIVGCFADTKDTERPFGATLQEIILDAVKEFDYPVCFDFPVSHNKENLALKIGVGYKLRVHQKKVTLDE